MAAHNRKKQGKSKTKLARKQVQAELSLPIPAAVRNDAQVVSATAPWPFPKSADEHGHTDCKDCPERKLTVLAPYDWEAHDRRVAEQYDPGLWFWPPSDEPSVRNTAEQVAPWAFAALAVLIALLVAALY